MDELEELRSAIERVRALHQPGPRIGSSVECSHCSEEISWPCPTITALDGAA